MNGYLAYALLVVVVFALEVIILSPVFLARIVVRRLRRRRR